MKLALGTAQFGLPYGIANREGQITRSVAKAMLQMAAVIGIDTLDTAIAYGESETCLGETGAQRFKLVTKLPAVPDACDNITGWINEQVSASLGRLGVHSVYGLLLHRPEQLLGTNGKELFQSLQDLKKNKLVQKIGISIYTPSELEALIPLYRFDLLQAPFNLIDRRLSTSGWLQRLNHDGVEIHTRSAFLQGLLLMSRSEIPTKFAPWGGLWDKWHDWLAHQPVTAVQACLAYPLSFPEIDRVVVGADSKDQLGQIIGSAVNLVPYAFPDLYCEDENLINPARWSQL
jgi:hypothetical protein